MPIIELELSGLSCERWFQSVQQAPAQVAGAEYVEVSRESARVDGAAAPQALLEAVRAGGYEARLP